MIVGSIAAILVTLWFYHSAPLSNRNLLHWAIAGFVMYFMVALFWTYFVNPAIKDAAMHSRNTVLVFVSRYAYILVALTCAAVFNLTFGRKKTK